MAPFSLALLILLSSMTSFVTSLQKRSDDVSLESLVTLVQQQAATINSQQATINALQNRLSSVETSLQQNVHAIADVSAKVNDVSSRFNTRVSFTAHMITAPVSISDSPFLFPAVVSNVGNGFNPNTGVFTAPVAGDYVFYAQIQNHVGADRTDFAIAKGGEQLCANELDQLTTGYDKASCFATVHLNQGEAVFVHRIKLYASGSLIEGNVWSSFSGQLIK